MGAGYHGGFGATSGKKTALKTGGVTSVKQNYTREQLLTFIDGVTKHSSEIVANINAGNIKLSFIGDELFERAFGVSSDVTGLAIDNKIYIRKSSITIHSDMVHEGTHALDYLRGISYSERAGWAGEIRAYTAEHHFQKAANITLEFANEDDIRVHVWKNYKRRGGK